MQLPTALDVYEARRRLAPHLSSTPLLPSPWLSSIADGTVHLKIESLTGNALKMAGRWRRGPEAHGTPPARRRHGDGIRRQLAGLALAAERLGLACVVFTPQNARKPSRTRFAVMARPSGDTSYDAAEKRARSADAEAAPHSPTTTSTSSRRGGGADRRTGFPFEVMCRRQRQQVGRGVDWRESGGASLRTRRRGGGSLVSVHAQSRSRTNHRDHAAPLDG